MKGGVPKRHVGAVVKDASFDASCLAWCDRADVELLTSAHDRVPQLVAAGGVKKVHFESWDRRPTRAADHDRDVADPEVVTPVVAQIKNLVAEELRQRVPRSRALHLHRVHVWIAHLGI